MMDLERTFQTLVDDPAAPPTDLATIERRAGRLRLRRRLATASGAIALVAVVGLSVTSLLATAPSAPVIGRPTEDGSSLAPSPGDGAVAPVETADPDATTAPTTAPTPEVSTPSPNPETDPPAWVTTDEKDAWQSENGRDGYWLPAYFLPPDYLDRPDSGELTTADLELRWRLLGPEADDDREQFIRAGFEALAGAEPQGDLVNALGGGAALDVVSSELSAEGRATVVFTDELLSSTSTGSSGAMAIMQQMRAMFSHYFPEATEGCIATASTADDPESTIAFHDMEVCPFALDR